jgi:hypothetical protein
MYYHCGVPMQAISEYTISDYSLNAKLIIVPSPCVLTQKCWDALLAAARAGATVAISGVLDADEHGLPVERSKVFGVPTSIEPVSQSEEITIGTFKLETRYEGEKMQRIEKAVVRSRTPLSVAYGLGHLLWSPLPLELGDSMPAVVLFYKVALMSARVFSIFSTDPYSYSVLVHPSLFRDVVLYTFISETDRDTTLQVTHLETRTRFPVTVPAERTAMVLLDRKSGRILSRSSRAN